MLSVLIGMILNIQEQLKFTTDFLLFNVSDDMSPD